MGGGTPVLQHEGSVNCRPSLLLPLYTPSSSHTSHPTHLQPVVLVLNYEQGVDCLPLLAGCPLNPLLLSSHTSHPTHSQPVVFVLQYERGVDVDQRVQNKHTADRQLKLVVILAYGCIHKTCEGRSSE